MNTDKLKGFLYGLVTSVTFGLIPLFTLPLMQKGLASDSILFYRFITATLALGIVMLVKGESFRIHWKDVPLLIVMALFYTASSMFLLYGYEVMGAGVATTLHFTYPIFTTLLMLVLFREKASWVTWLAIVLAVGGVARLSLQGTSLKLDPWGVFIVLTCTAASWLSTYSCSPRSLSPSRMACKTAFNPSPTFLRWDWSCCWPSRRLSFPTSRCCWPCAISEAP